MSTMAASPVRVRKNERGLSAVVEAVPAGVSCSRARGPGSSFATLSAARAASVGAGAALGARSPAKAGAAHVSAAITTRPAATGLAHGIESLTVNLLHRGLLGGAGLFTGTGRV